MPKVKVEAKKMSSPRAQFISLVGRGANKVPFRIIKQEKDTMGQRDLDLAGLFRTKKQEVEPQVVGVVTMKDENFEQVKQQVSDLGYHVEDAIEMEDGSVVFKQGDEEVDGTVVRLNDHVVLVVKGFEPYNMDAEVLPFGDKAAAHTFFPGVRATMEALGTSVYQTMRKADNPAEAGEMVAKMFDEAKKYIASMAKSLPEKAFKAEDISIAPASAGEQKDEEQGTSVAKSDDAAAEGQSEAGADDAGETVAKEEDKGAAEEATTLTEEKVTEIVTGALAASLDKITKSIEASQTAVAGFAEQLKGLQDRVEKSETAVKEAKEAVGGVLVGGSDSGDVLPVAKSEQSEGLGCFDTAFHKVRGK